MDAKCRPVDRRLALEALEPGAWGAATFDSPLVRRCYEAARTPLDQLGAAQLRVLLGQRLGLAFVVPVALDKLEDDPLLTGDFYPGTCSKRCPARLRNSGRRTRKNAPASSG